jgi:hypothetical protein
MGDLTHLKLPADAKPREHVTIPVEGMAAALASAEEMGYRRALVDARVELRLAHRLRLAHELLYQTRCDLYAAIWRRKEKGL